MLNSRESFQEAIKHFPRWMDIRKRAEKSDGGKFLRSIIMELDEIQKAIIDYKKDFFIINYIGREDEVIDYLYIAEIGDIEERELSILKPKMEYTTDLKEFYYNKEPIAFYEEGKLAFKVKDAEGLEHVKYSLDNFSYTSKLRKQHIWNVLDEFALFSGIRRYEGETNKQLLQRTLLTYRNRTNSTETGIKNAIINAVSTYDTVLPNEISIDRPNEDSLHKEDREHGTVIEKLTEINQDIFRTKKWDLNKWEHNFKKLDYASPEWDTKLDVIQDGVGHNDSLKASFISEIDGSETTDIQVDGYKKSEVRINEYIRNRRMDIDIDLQLRKYKNTLKPNPVEYKITATDVMDITNNNIHVDCYQINKGEKYYDLEDFVLNHDDIDHITVKRNELEKGKKYKLRFYPSSDYAEMIIHQCDVIKEGIKSSLLAPKGNFVFNESGALHNSNVKFHSSSLKDFMYHDNVLETKDGLILDDSARQGELAIDVTNMKNQYVKIEHSCRTTNIVRNPGMVNYQGFVINDANELESTEKEGEIVIDLECTQLTFSMVEGNCIVTKIIDGEAKPSEIWFDPKTDEMKFDKSTHVKVIIKKMPNDQKLIINNIRYARYDIDLQLTNGNLIHTHLGTIIPNTSGENHLRIFVNSYSSFSPVIKFIHIGSSLKNAVYETDVFTGEENSKLEINTNCIVHFVELDDSENEVNVIENYSTKNLYKNNTTSPVYVKVNTDNFVNIKNSIPEVERFNYQGEIASWIKIEPGEELDKIFIDGYTKTIISRIRINELLNVRTDDLVYISHLLKGFIVKRGNQEEFIQVRKEDLNPLADAYEIKNIPSGVKSSFVIDNSNNSESIANYFDQNFQLIYLFPEEAQEYVAYNKVNMLMPKVTNVEIVDVFAPIIPKNKLMLYIISEIRSSSISGRALFEKSGELTNWSLGRKTIQVELDIEPDNAENYDLDLDAISQRFMLSNHIELDRYYEVDNQMVDLAEYVITPPADMRIVYNIERNNPETIIAEEDGFNKLHYSNVHSIISIKKANGTSIPESDYELLHDEGIIAWNNSDLIGEKITIEYRYKVPQYLTFINPERLYELAGYNVDAYSHSFTLSYRNVKDNIVLPESDYQRIKSADRIIISSSNPNYVVHIEDGVIRLSKAIEEERIVIKNGFFYQDGLEYFYFINRNTNMIEKLSHIDLINVLRLSGEVRFHHSSRNYLPGSGMMPGRKNVVSMVDFENNKNIDGISSMNALTACDNFNLWNAFETDISIVNSRHGLGTRFTPRSKYNYAIMEITDYIYNGSILSFYSDGDLSISIGKEKKHGSLSFTKSIFAEPREELNKNNNYQYYVFNNLDNESKYYLIVQGEGVIDDIVVSDYVSTEQSITDHTKNIEKLGFEVDEHEYSNFKQSFLFDNKANKLHQLDVRKDGVITVGHNVDWGVTKLEEFKNNWRQLTLKDADLMHDRYIRTTDRFGVIESPPIFIRDRESVYFLLLKINDVLLDATGNMKIEILTSGYRDRNYRLVGSAEGNILTVAQKYLSNYVKFRIEMPPEKIINNIELYANYAETNTPLPVNRYRNGELITKVYDAGAIRHYKLSNIIVEHIKGLEHMEFSVRGLRQEGDRSVWTEWKNIQLNDELEVTNEVEFQDYRYFQFRIALNNEHAELKIDRIDFEVI